MRFAAMGSAEVKIINSAGTVLGTTTADNNGNYSLQVDPGSNYMVRARRGNVMMKAFLDDANSSKTVPVNPGSSAKVKVMAKKLGNDDIGEEGTDFSSSLSSIDVGSLMSSISQSDLLSQLTSAISNDILDNADYSSSTVSVGLGSTAGDDVAITISTYISITIINIDTSDTSAPSGSVSIYNNLTSTDSAAIYLSLSATDNTGITAYYISESPVTPTAIDSGWVNVVPAADYNAIVSFTLSNTGGEKTIYVYYKDGVGQISSVASATITLNSADTTAPSGLSVSIESGAASTTSTSVTIAISGADDVGVTTYYLSETSATPSATATGWVSVTSATNYSSSVSFELSGSTGTKTVYLWLKDASDNISSSASDTISLEATDTGTAPSSPGNVSASAGDGQATITWSSVTGADSYTLYRGTSSGVTTATTNTISTTSTSYTHTGLTNDTTYYYIVTATNSVGESSASSEVSATPTASGAAVDTTAPSAPTISTSSSTTSDTTPTVTGTAEADSTVTLYDTDGTTSLGTATATGGDWSITASTLSEAAHTITAKATDAAGNTSSASTSITVTVDTTAPSAPTISTSSSTTNDATPTITGTAEADSTVELFDDATSVGTATATGGEWSITASTLSEAAHTITAKATDAAGNTSSASSSITVTVDTTAPTVTFQSPLADATGVAVDSTISATFSEEMDTSTITTSTFTINNSVTGSIAMSGSDTIATFTPSANLSNNTTYTATLTSGITDLAGNGITETSWSFTTIVGTPTGVSATAGDTQVEISWTAVTGATSYNIYWNTTGSVTTSDTKIPGATSPYTHSSLTNGTTYYYIVTAVNAGGESSASSEASATPSESSVTYTDPFTTDDWTEHWCWSTSETGQSHSVSGGTATVSHSSAWAGSCIKKTGIVVDGTKDWTLEVTATTTSGTYYRGATRLIRSDTTEPDKTGSKEIACYPNLEGGKLLGPSTAVTSTACGGKPLKLTKVGNVYTWYVGGVQKAQETIDDPNLSTSMYPMLQASTSASGGSAYFTNYSLTYSSSATLFSDDFSSGNYDNWSLHASSGASFSVVDGELQQSNTAAGVNYHALYYPGGFGWSDYTFELNTRHISNYYSVTSINIYFRIQNGQYNPSGEPVGYTVQIQPPSGGSNHGGLYKKTASGAELIQLFSTDLTYPNYTGYDVKIQVVGSSIKVWVDDALLIDATDSTYSSGSIALASVHVVAGFDDVVVTQE